MPITLTRPRVKNGRAAKAQSTINWQEVAQVAYELYEQRGRVDGHDLQDWLEAQRIVQERLRSGNGR